MTHASRRSLLAAMGAVAVGGYRPVPGPDPIFAALAEYKRASSAYCEITGDYEGDLMGWEAFPDLWEAYNASTRALESTIPTTAAGAAAVLAFFLDDDPEWACGWHASLVHNVAEVLQRLAG